MIDTKTRLLHRHASQMYEWLPYDGGYLETVPDSEEERLRWLQARQEVRDGRVAERYRQQLVSRYGAEAGTAIHNAEAFEISEYGRGIAPDEVDTYFPR